MNEVRRNSLITNFERLHELQNLKMNTPLLLLWVWWLLLNMNLAACYIILLAPCWNDSRELRKISTSDNDYSLPIIDKPYRD